MWAFSRMPVGASSVPAQIDIFGDEASSNSTLEPHSTQKPRFTVGETECHLRPRASVSRNPSRSTAVYAPTWPCHRRHLEQWQYVTAVKGALTSNRTASQKQPPLFMGRPHTLYRCRGC